MRHSCLAAAWWLALSLASPASADAPGAPLTAFKDCADCPEMVVLPVGEFAMGAPEGEGPDGERPVHTVVIARPFAVSRYEITSSEWKACVADGACPADTAHHPYGNGKGPVTDVNFADAMAFIAWLGTKTGRSYRLLSEAEWEYAARAGTTDAFPWGNEPGQENGVCGECGTRWDGRKPAPVGSFVANAWGLHDMHGNVSEWTGDCWNQTHAGAPADGSARTTGDCERRVIRGGNWTGFARHMRSAARLPLEAEDRYLFMGIRVARSLEQ